MHLAKLFQGFNIAMYGLNGGRINIGEQQKVTYAILFLDVVCLNNITVRPSQAYLQDSIDEFVT